MTNHMNDEYEATAIIERGIEQMLEPCNRDACRRIWSENRKLFSTAKGSLKNHQAWEGGYLHHIAETFRIAQATYTALSAIRPLESTPGFLLADAYLALFLHDIEKPWKYGNLDGQRPDLSDDARIHAFRHEKIREYGFSITPDVENAILYAHGEGSEYSATRRTRCPLAAFVGMCDTASARIWFDQPRGE